MIIIVSFLLLALPLALQAQHCMDDRYAQTALFDSTQVAMIPGEHYATSVRWPGTQVDSLRLDIYMPDANIDPVEKRPLIVMMHGGALLTGQRQDMAYYCMEMARRGFVAATVTYRLGWDCPATDLLGICGMCQSMTHKWRVAMYRGAQDARAAIRHLASRAEELGIDTSFVFLQGESAGALNALHASFLSQDIADQWCPTCRDEVGLLDTAGNSHTSMPSIAAVVNHCGALGISDTILDQWDIPVVSFHDNQDIVVPYGYGQFVNCLTGAFGSQRIHNRLVGNGICSQLNTVVNGLLQAPHCSYPRNALIPKAACFLKGVMCETCASSSTTQIWNTPDCTAGLLTAAEQPQHVPMGIAIHGEQLTLEGMLSPVRVRIADMLGRTLHAFTTHGQSVRLPQLPHQPYIVSVADAKGRNLSVRWMLVE
jgi:hypothetical protein